MRTVFVSACLALVAGCDLVAGPGDRARDFVEHLVAAESPVPLEPADGLGARIALDYLRALRRQGTKLDYTIADTKRNPRKTVVRLHVASAPGVAGARAAAPVRLVVELDRDANGAWRVVRWQADD